MTSNYNLINSVGILELVWPTLISQNNVVNEAQRKQEYKVSIYKHIFSSFNQDKFPNGGHFPNIVGCCLVGHNIIGCSQICVTCCVHIGHDLLDLHANYLWTFYMSNQPHFRIVSMWIVSFQFTGTLVGRNK